VVWEKCCTAPEFTNPALVIKLVLTWERGRKNLASWVLHHPIRVGAMASGKPTGTSPTLMGHHVADPPGPQATNLNTDPHSVNIEKPRNDARTTSPSL
jgi:hypothetical protein